MSSNLRYPSPGGHGRRQNVDAEAVEKAYGNGTQLKTARGHGRRVKPTVTRVQSAGLKQRSGHGRKSQGTGNSKLTHIGKALIPSSMLASASQVGATGTAQQKKPATAPKAPKGLTGMAGTPGVSKAAYDPEGKRHRRAGVVAGASLGAGGLLLARGGKGARRATKELRIMASYLPDKTAGEQALKARSLQSVAAGRGDLARIGGGTALVGGGAGAYRYGGTRRGKSWS